MEQPFRQGSNSEAEESAVLEAVTQGKAGEDTAGWNRLSVCYGDV
jgi:hypothetical protein